MATPLNMIKTGIITADLDLIAEAYKLLTGEIVSPPHIQIDGKFEVEIPLEISPRDEFDTENFRRQIVDPKKQSREGQSGRLTRTEPINLRKIQTVGNLFQDEKEIAPEDTTKKDSKGTFFVQQTKKGAKKIYLPKPSQRVREKAAEPQEYSCETCGRKAKLLPIHVVNDRYICDSCVKKLARNNNAG